MAESSIHELRPIHHFGVYAVCYDDEGKLLTVRKEFGLYKGLLDLPGGQPDGDEEPAETLARLLTKETGGVLLSVGEFDEYEFVVKETSSGEPIHYHHTAVVARVQITGVDPEKVVWHRCEKEDAQISELVRKVLR